MNIYLLINRIEEGESPMSSNTGVFEGTALNRGFFFAGSISLPTALSASVIANDETQTLAMLFILPYRQTVKRIIVAGVAMPAADGKFAVALYDENKDLIFQSDTLDGSADIGPIEFVLDTPLVIDPGAYYQAQACNQAWIDNGGQTTGIDYESNSMPARLLNQTAPRRSGQTQHPATFDSETGLITFPPTLGNISYTDFSPLLVCYEG